MKIYKFVGPGKALAATIVVIAATKMRARKLMMDEAQKLGLMSDKFELIEETDPDEFSFVAYSWDGDY